MTLGRALVTRLRRLDSGTQAESSERELRLYDQLVQKGLATEEGVSDEYGRWLYTRYRITGRGRAALRAARESRRDPAKKPARTRWVESQDLQIGDVILSGGPPAEVLTPPEEHRTTRDGYSILLVRMKVRDRATGEERIIAYPYESTVQIENRGARDRSRRRRVRHRRSRRDPAIDFKRVDEVARGMLDRYSKPTVAAEMAWHHAMDHWTPREDSERFLYWKAVRDRIYELGSRGRR